MSAARRERERLERLRNEAQEADNHAAEQDLLAAVPLTNQAVVDKNQLQQQQQQQQPAVTNVRDLSQLYEVATRYDASFLKNCKVVSVKELLNAVQRVGDQSDLVSEVPNDVTTRMTNREHIGEHAESLDIKAQGHMMKNRWTTPHSGQIMTSPTLLEARPRCWQALADG